MLFYVVLQGFVVGALFGWLTSKIKKFSSGKKGFLVLFIFLGIVYFIVFPTGLGIGMLLVRIFPLLLGLTHLSLFVPICFTAYVLLVILILDKYSKRKLLMLIAILSIHLLVIIIPFPVCNSSGRFSDTTQSCTCLGLSKYSMVIDASWTQCVGIPINYGQTNKALLRQESNIPIDTCGNSICEEYELIATCQEDCNDLETHTYQICRNTRNKWGGITGISIYGTNISLPGETRIISNISNNNETNKLDVTTETYICYNITEVHEPIFGISIKSGAGHFPACRHLVHKYYVDGVSYDCEEEMGTYRGNIMYYPYDEERFELFRRVILSKYVEKYSEEYFSCEDNAFCHIKTALENNDFNHCSKLAADSAALCVNRFAEAHENRSYCDNLNGSYRDHCYYGFDQPLIRRAELRKNESYCNQVYVPWSRAKCHISLGNNVSINVTTCENLSEKTELECIMYLAKSSNNHTYCNQTSELKGPCFLYFAKMLNQSDLCYKAEGTMGRCLNQFYFKSVDPLICGELENNYYKYEYCIN